MKRRFMVPVVAVAVFGLMAAFATVAQAFPTKTTACTGCHSGVNVPVTATAGATSGTTVTYQLNAPTATAIAVFDGATKVATLGASGTFSATAGKTYAVYAVTGPTTGDGVGSMSFTVAAPVVVPTAPAAPVLSTTYNTTTGNVTIAWTAVSGATGYDYQVGTGAVASTTGTSVSLTGLAVGNTAFKLRATNSGGPSAYAAATIVYTVPVVVPTAPAAPVLSTTYNTTTGNVTIAWTAVSGATGYDYQVGTGAVASTTGTSVSLTGLAVGNTAFKLRATNSGGPSAYAAATIVYTVPVVVPNPTGYPVKLHLDVNQRYNSRLTAVLTDQVTGAKFTAKPDSDGDVSFSNVPVGTYTLTVTGSRRVRFHARTIVVSAPGTPRSDDHDND